MSWWAGEIDHVMCLGQRHGRDGGQPGRAGVYAAQHTPGRECVSGGAPAGRHVPAPGDGKNRPPRSVVSARRKRPLWFNRLVYYLFLHLFILTIEE